MRIIRFAAHRSEEPRFGLWVENSAVDLTDVYPSFQACLAAACDGSLSERMADERPRQALANVRLLAPIDVSNKVLCVALNYRTHVDENKVTHPERPILFLKTREALIDPADEIHSPSITNFLDYEAELAAVVGRTAKNITTAEAYDYLIGYTLLNDVTGRDLVHVKSGDRTRNDYFSAKCLDHTTPIGPAIITKDQFGDPAKALLEGVLNGITVQHATLSELIVSIPELVAYASARSTLHAGDIIATGTPGGVGKARGRGLMNGDVFEVKCGPIPPLRNKIRAV
jgi:acylpyruvate hydrolase